MTLQQFMASEEDRRRFENTLQPLGGDGGIQDFQPGVLHATLRASGGTLLNVEIFYVHFSTLDNRGHYLVGIREFSDETPALLASSPSMKKSAIKGHAAMAVPGRSRGTPAVQAPGLLTQAEIVECSADFRLESSGSSGSEDIGVRPRCLTLPGCKFTSERARDFSLITAMRSWNAPARPVACCRFHSGAKELRASANRIAKRKCLQTFKLFGEAQCSNCGILSLWDADDDDEDDEQEPRYCTCCSGRYIRKNAPSNKASL